MEAALIRKVFRITLVVHSQEDALRFYVDKLGFKECADFPMGPGQRWLTIAPMDESELEIVLQPLDWFSGVEREEHAAMIGHNPSIVFRVDNCRKTCEELQARGVRITIPPEKQSYGVQAVAEDLYGNSLVLLEEPGAAA
jgi:catechol 2,3-dioxygenase-like lactoylglutathione lyase family enzyme